MKLNYWLLVAVLMSFCIAYGSENLAPLDKGGRMEFTGRPIREEVLYYAFDGDRSTQFTYDISRVAANRNVPIDRIWDYKVKIDRIELRTTGSGRAYEYKFFYWDLVNQEWKEIVHVEENSSMNPIHNLKPPVVTNKIRYVCLKTGVDGNANFHNIYEIYYYGEVLPNIPTNAPENVSATVNETGLVIVSWDTPEPNEDGEIPKGYNIYRGNRKDFQPSTDNLVAESVSGNRWFDLSADVSGSLYYIVQSVGEFGEGKFSTAVLVKK